MVHMNIQLQHYNNATETNSTQFFFFSVCCPSILVNRSSDTSSIQEGWPDMFTQATCQPRLCHLKILMFTCAWLAQWWSILHLLTWSVTDIYWSTLNALFMWLVNFGNWRIIMIDQKNLFEKVLISNYCILSNVYVAQLVYFPLIALLVPMSIRHLLVLKSCQTVSAFHPSSLFLATFPICILIRNK